MRPVALRNLSTRILGFSLAIFSLIENVEAHSAKALLFPFNRIAADSLDQRIPQQLTTGFLSDAWRTIQSASVMTTGP